MFRSISGSGQFSGVIIFLQGFQNLSPSFKQINMINVNYTVRWTVASIYRTTVEKHLPPPLSEIIKITIAEISIVDNKRLN